LALLALCRCAAWALPLILTAVASTTRLSKDEES
jgi:hypothetical protein